MVALLRSKETKEVIEVTRGQIAIITYSDEIFTSLEFNGDMYPEGYGKDAIKALKKVKDFDSYMDAVDTFNATHHNYDDEQLVYHYEGEQVEKHHMLDMSQNYFDNWFSDYLYIKNVSEDEQIIVDKDTKKLIKVPPQAIVILYFGRLEQIITQ